MIPYVLCYHSCHIVMSSSTVAPESVVVELERPPSTVFEPSTLFEEYWPLTLDTVRNCNLSYIHGDWDRAMIRDGLNAVVLVSELPQIQKKEIEVWKYLSQYSPPEDRGFMFSAGDDNIISLVQNKMTVGHSGYSMAWVMRHIEFIAKNGLPAHRKMILKFPGRARCY